MRKYIIKNCPAGQIVTSAVNPQMAGVYCKKEHKPCQDFKHCLLKQIFEKLCNQTHIPDIDDKFEEILNLIEWQEIYQ